jgi:1-acyl-sn-glycerol-3-phosphate acyltransferase
MSLYTSRHPLARVVSFAFSTYVKVYVRPRVRGRENLPQEGGFILAANHSSHADTAVLFAALPRTMRKRVVAGAAQDYFFQGGPWQTVSRMLFNAIPISRDTSQRTRDPLRHVVRALREGYGVLMFPEGTRSTDGTVGPFRPGIGRLIAEFPGTPIVPVWIDGTNRVLPKGKSVPRPYKVGVFFGETHYFSAHPHHRATWQAAANQVREAVLRLGTPPAEEDVVENVKEE